MVPWRKCCQHTAELKGPEQSCGSQNQSRSPRSCHSHVLDCSERLPAPKFLLSESWLLLPSQFPGTLQSSSSFLQLNLLQPFPSKTMLKSFKGSQALSSRTQRKRADRVSPPSLAVPSSHAANFQHILTVYLVCSNLLCIVLCGVQAQELRIQRGIQHSGKPWSFGDSAPHAAARG